MVEIYNKAIRDRIPEIIKESGRTCKISILSDEDFLIELEKKLSEELEEYSRSKLIEELADIIEVILRILELKGKSIDELNKIRLEKKERSGGFHKNLFLIQVD